MLAIILLAFFGVATTAIPTSPQRISGGELTTIASYPEMAVMLFSTDLVIFKQACGGAILNRRSILTAAHCISRWWPAENYRVRVGSSLAHSGGVVHQISSFIVYPDYPVNLNGDIAILRTASLIDYNNVVRPASIAGTGYIPADNEVVWTAGWGVTSENEEEVSEQLRHVQLWTINQEVCRARYDEAKTYIYDNMICAGSLDVGIRDMCRGDSGSPTFHRGTVVGVLSFSYQCGNTYFPAVSTRVSSFTPWIQANA